MSPYSWYPFVSGDYGFAFWSKWTHQSLLWLHNPIGSGNLFLNVCRCNWRCLFGVLFLPFLVSSDLPSQLTTRQMSFPSSQPASSQHVPDVQIVLERSVQMVGSELQNLRGENQGKKQGRLGLHFSVPSLLSFFFLNNFTSAFYYLKAWNRLVSNVCGKKLRFPKS